MASWPTTLQEKVNQAGFRKVFGSTTIRSNVEVGANKVRRRFTKGIDQFSVNVNLARSEYSTFENFYEVTLNGGTNTFDFLNPLTDTIEEFRFVGEPSITPIGGNEFVLQMTWEQLP